MGETPDDPLDDLRRRIEATREAAERLAGEAAGAREDVRAGREPSNGWRTTEDHQARTSEIQSIVALLESLRGLVPAELAEQVTEVIKQVLLLLRAVIDWLVERLDTAGPPSTGAGPDVQDIPIG